MKKTFKLVIIILFCVCIFGCNNKKIDREKDLDIFEITTQEGTNLTFEYVDFDGYSIKIPANLSLMSDEVKSIKYPTEKTPKVVYTNDDASINIALENEKDALENNQIIEYTKQMEKLLGSFGEIKSVDNFKRDNHNIGEIKVITQAIDTEIFNHMIFFSIDGQLKAINFNYIIEYYEEFEEVSDLVINSIKFN